MQSLSALAQDLGKAVRRRDFITLLGGAAVAASVGARAQQAEMPVIGFLNTASPDAYVSQLKAFHQALKEAGFCEIEFDDRRRRDLSELPVE
jgi:putative ABC transport system substrate-binding protein